MRRNVRGRTGKVTRRLHKSRPQPVVAPLLRVLIGLHENSLAYWALSKFKRAWKQNVVF
jgi:hypothetical protein